MTDDDLQDVLTALSVGDHQAATDKIDALMADVPEDTPVGLQSRIARVAATAHRLSGDAAGASALAARAAELAASPDNHDPVVAIEAELETGDAARSLGRVTHARSAYARALRLCERVEVAESVTWRVRLRLADLEATTGDPQRATEVLDQLMDRFPDVPPDAQAAAPEPFRHLADALDDLVSGRPDGALDHLEAAALAARRQRDVPAYVSAKLAAAQVHEQLGDRDAVIRELWSGWATLRSAVDPELARSGFEPALEDCRSRWGEAAFDDVTHRVSSTLTGDSASPGR